ncbi:MAG: CoA-binding protein [Candidatus Helarchaeota archaeon]|nr:CoA-binding protein [Candidatus Helarchaeota archaeon]
MGDYDIENLEFLFNPKSVAIFGAGKDLNKVAGQVLLHLKMGKYKGKIIPINPKKETIFNIETIPSIKNIPEQIDLAIMAIPKKYIFPALEECIEESVKFVIILTAGFQETNLFDENSRKEQEKLKSMLNLNTRIIGPNCMGIASTSSNLNAVMGINPIPLSKTNRNMSFVSQSGTWAARSMRCSIKHDLGVSKIVSSGNEIDLTCEDFLEYFSFYDKSTQVIGSFIEELRKGRKFIKIASESKKPIIILRAGTTEAGSKAALSHTGSISTRSNLYESVFKQYGIIEATSLSELIDYLRAFSIFLAKGIMPKGNRVGIYTVGGGMGVLASDKCVNEGLEVVNLSTETIDKLNGVSGLPSIWSHNNPIDLIATRDFSTTEKVLKILIEAEEVDMIISITPFGISHQMSSLENLPDMPQKIKEFNEKMLQAYHKSVVDHLLKMAKISNKPIIIPTALYSTDFPYQYEEISDLMDAGVCVVNNVGDAAKTLAKLVKFQEKKTK